MYENSLHVNPTIRNFWKNLKKSDGDFHPFKKNRNLVFFGDNLSKKSFNYIDQRIKQLGLSYNFQEIQEALFKILTCEKGHTERLTELAVQAVTTAFEVPEEVLNPNLNEDSNVKLNKTEENNDENWDYESLSQDLKNKINKRILLNCIVQGASIHSYYTLHHVVKKEIEEINSDLISLYDLFSVNSVRSYFSIDYSALLENALMAQAGAMGSSEVDFEDEENPQVHANAKSFPVLCQELVKGAMELITMHSLKDESEKDLKAIYYFSDQRVDEPRYIQIGSEVWRNILNLNKELKLPLPELVMKISLMDCEKVESFFEKLFEHSSDVLNYFENDDEEEINFLQ